MAQSDVAEVIAKLQSAFRSTVPEDEKPYWYEAFSTTPPQLLQQAVNMLTDDEGERRLPNIVVMRRYLGQARRANGQDSMPANAHSLMPAVRDQAKAVYDLRTGALKHSYPGYTMRQAMEDVRANYAEIAADLAHDDVMADSWNKMAAACDYVLQEGV